MAMELHDKLSGLIGRALKVEELLAARPYREPVEHVCKLDELRSSRLQAEELMRCMDTPDRDRESSFGAIFQEVSAKLEREIEECECCVETPVAGRP